MIETVPEEVRAYLAAVGERLEDLPPREREDLLAEVASSLAETAAEGDASITARLGPPDTFAAELRAAAGLGSAPAPVASATLLARARALLGPEARRLGDVAHELAPIWWFLRAYLAVALVAWLTGASWSTWHPGVPRFGSTSLGLAVLAAAVVVSLWLGVRMRRSGSDGGRLVLAANLLLLLAVVPAVNQINERPPTEVIVEPSALPMGLSLDGEALTNVYPYTRDGKLLHDVLLYTGSGQPIEMGRSYSDVNRRVLVTSRGDRIFNSFPIRFYDPGTSVVADPDAAPPLTLPEVAPNAVHGG